MMKKAYITVHIGRGRCRVVTDYVNREGIYECKDSTVDELDSL